MRSEPWQRVRLRAALGTMGAVAAGSVFAAALTAAPGSASALIVDGGVLDAWTLPSPTGNPSATDGSVPMARPVPAEPSSPSTRTTSLGPTPATAVAPTPTQTPTPTAGTDPGTPAPTLVVSAEPTPTPAGMGGPAPAPTAAP